MKELIDQIGGRDKIEAIATYSGKYDLSTPAKDVALMARALLAVLDAQEKPFMYAISDCDGQAHFDETCVSAHRCDLEDVVGSLNEFRDDVDDGYSIVPVYTVTPAASVPDGYKLAPIEPSKEMLLASKRYKAKNKVPTGPGVYRAMIAAAPVPGGDGG